MSIAGIQSNRGDGYQTLVAFDWVLSMLAEPSYEWLEVDAVRWNVDDVVIGRTDGSVICCQCKKNQSRFAAWSLAELADELRKAIAVLSANPQATVRFYSGSPFGSLAALKNYSTNHPDEVTYVAQMGEVHRATDQALRDLITSHGSSLTTFEFLTRVLFESTPSIERMHEKVHEGLSLKVNNHSAAFSTLWTKLDHLGLRIPEQNDLVATKHRLRRADLLALLEQRGCLLASPIDNATINESFRATSSVGRTWCRDIAGVRLPNAALPNILAAIDQKVPSVLLTGAPGAGKTCVMLDLQDELERRVQADGSICPLFIQSREFADLLTVQDRQAQGLSGRWTEEAARAAEFVHVVVVIDSLDVLSIARERHALTHFLAQIDRLHHIPNVTVVTACREFDRHYDRRIAQVAWGKVVACQALDWDREIAPLLMQQGIETEAIDQNTRSLITNPRELSMFLELAERSGSFNVVSGRDLASRYLRATVEADPALGQDAMRAIEAVAEEMLNKRSLAVNRQRFTASQDILRRLLSQDVLRETHDGKLTFGHQTLLDVLVVSDALRKGMTLSDFILSRPAVPFVRPSIRSFIAQLASGERREFRKQLRTVLTGTSAFHIRRLVAEAFAEAPPTDEDWPLIRDLRKTEPSVFQVIYVRATRPEWHYFWLNHLVPLMLVEQDGVGLQQHANIITRWTPVDAAGVLRFWTEALEFNGANKNDLVWRLGLSLRDFDVSHAASIGPLLLSLLSLSTNEHDYLGRPLARCVNAGVVHDTVLWSYVTKDLTDEAIRSYQLGKKLRCQPHDLDDQKPDFLAQRMKQSTVLLDLAIADVERWSQLRYGIADDAKPTLHGGFLQLTSFRFQHSEVGHQPADSQNYLMEAIEAAIVHHAQIQSDWWLGNQVRMSKTAEGSIRYFVVKACIAESSANIALIKRLFGDKELLESELSYELGSLLHAIFVELIAEEQDAIQTMLLGLHGDHVSDPQARSWVLLSRAQYLVGIPAHLRTVAAHAVLEECSTFRWPFIRTPDIGPRGGTVRAPFSFQVFLDATDNSVLRLLGHYAGYRRAPGFDADFLVGGESQVAWQLREAASRQPLRFIQLLASHWTDIADRFRGDILDGVATYLAHRYAGLQTSNGWIPLEEPDAVALARAILEELERHPNCWAKSRSAAKAIEACSHVLKDTSDLERLLFLSVSFLSVPTVDPSSNDTLDLLTAGINMEAGNIAEAAMVIAIALPYDTRLWPEYLIPLLHQVARYEHPGVRAVLLRRLPYFQSRHPEIGWQLFRLAMTEPVRGLWKLAEPCLYYAYRESFHLVAPWLESLREQETPDAHKCLGRISALAAFAGHIAFSSLLTLLEEIDSPDAWSGAVSVWSHYENLSSQREQCLAGLAAALSLNNPHAAAVVSRLSNLIRDDKSPQKLPIDLMRRYFDLQTHQAQESGRPDFFGVEEWLGAVSIIDPPYALNVAEILLDIALENQLQLYDHADNWPQILTRMFSQAEEQEEADSGDMLNRVVAVQDKLLTIGVSGIDTWLKNAERSVST